MKVLILNQVFYPDSAATAQHLTDLAIHLKKKGCEVTVLAGNRNYERREIVYSKFEDYQGIKIHRVGSTGFGKKSFFHRFVDAVTFDFCLILKLLMIPKHDVIIAFTSPPLISLFGSFFKILKGGRLVEWMMDVNPEAAIAVGYLRKESLVTRFLIQVFRWSLLHADQAVVLDRYMKEKIVAHGFDPEKVVIIPPWPVHEVTRPEPSSLATENPFRKKHGLQGKFVVLFSGNHSIVHPFDTLLESARVLKDRKDIAFVFIGGGLRAEEVTAFKEKHGLGNILQLPYQPREVLKTSLAMANLHVVVMGEKVNGLVHTSKIYGILATGAPYVAIAPRRSHLGDVLEACPYGYLVEHGNPGQLVKVIHEAQCLTVEQLKLFEKSNLDYVLNEYSSESILDRVYRSVVLGETELPNENFTPRHAAEQ